MFSKTRYLKNVGKKAFKEEVQGNVITIKPGETVELNRRLAVMVKGTYTGLNSGIILKYVEEKPAVKKTVKKTAK